MVRTRVLLICGSGASSGFLAGNIRKAAVERGVDISVVARGDSELENYIDDIDVLMIGPHLAYILDEIDEHISGRPVTVIAMKPEYYSTLDGHGALDHLLQELAQKGTEA